MDATIAFMHGCGTSRVRLKVSYKIALLIALLIVALGIAQVVVATRLLIPSFDTLERENAHVDMDRVADALHGEIDQLAVTSRDYGDWTELYRFMDDRNSAGVHALSQQQFHDLKVDVLILFDAEGRIVWSLAAPPGSSAARALDASAPPSYVAALPWRAALRTGGSGNGLLSTEDGPLIASIAPILDGDGGGSSRGGVLLGRYLTRAQIGRIAEQAHVKVELLTGMSNAGALHIQDDTLNERETVTEIYRTLKSVDGRATFTLRAHVPRTISRHGRRIVMFATLSLTVIGTLILGLLLITLRRMVLAPLAHLTDHAIEIGRRDNMAMRLNIDRSDEIGVLAHEFDRMMERVEAARREIVARSFEAGVGEMASGALHNIGNAITPLTVRIEGLRQRLRAAPAADVEPTITEIATSRTDAARHADCEALLELLARECAKVIVRSEEELEIIRRQVEDVKQLLAEQKRFARRGPIAEDTSVEALVRQAAEVIPEDLLATIRIEIDPLIEKMGTRRLPRIALQQVLQNIMLNAAESIREGGRGSGVIRVSAREMGDGDGGKDLLDLTLTDDGAGVAPENVSRLFERGFTTKSHVTNSGFGLHWCANVLNALGGAISATSEGAGRGACLRVLVPAQTTSNDSARQAA
jgi:sensor domain CHASE-containing protein